MACLRFRIICPDGFYKSWYLNNANPALMQWRTFFWEECWPEMDRRYGLKADKTFIDGLSMGGHGAMNLFLDHPERFFDMDFMEIVCVPADMGRYVIENLSPEPVRIHKTMLRDGFENDPA